MFHGHAHGTELPASADAISYAIGFVISTGFLHLVGIAFGLLTARPVGVIALRGAGAVIALLGVGFLFGVV